MRLTDALRPEHIVSPLPAVTVREAVLALVQRLTETGALRASERLEKLTPEARIRDLIHLGDRVLLPHLRTDAVREVVVALGITPQPLKQTPGGEAGTEQVVVLVLAPPAAAQLYLQMVAALARVFRQDDVVDELVAAHSPAQVLRIAEVRDLVLPPRLSVRDVMTQRVYRVAPDTPLRELMELMSRHDLKAVPVVNEKREVLGMVTERDAAAPPLAAEAQTREIMSRSVMCVSEEQSLADVVAIMISKEVERVPVVNEGQLVGFLTRGDIIRKLFGR